MESDQSLSGVAVCSTDVAERATWAEEAKGVGRFLDAASTRQAPAEAEMAEHREAGHAEVADAPDSTLVQAVAGERCDTDEAAQAGAIHEALPAADDLHEAPAPGVPCETPDDGHTADASVETVSPAPSPGTTPDDGHTADASVETASPALSPGTCVRSDVEAQNTSETDTEHSETIEGSCVRSDVEAQNTSETDTENSPTVEGPVLVGDNAIDTPILSTDESKCIPGGYPEVAANYFGEYGAHRLRWAHAVNSKRRLRGALSTFAHFLEADVASGPLVAKDAKEEKRGREANAGVETDTLVKTAKGEPVIMAHYPTEHSSDLSFENFMLMVLRHNDRVLLGAEARETNSSRTRLLGEGADLSTGHSRPSSRRACATGSEEANVFARELDRELDQAAVHGGSITASCVGSRRDHPMGRTMPHATLKGVKLDFKRFDTVAPCIEHLRTINAAKRLGGHLWLNADVFAGPGALLTPFDAKQFVRMCAEALPEAVLSLSWGASMLSTMKSYSNEMVDHMIELCMTPIVPRELPHAARHAGDCKSHPQRHPANGRRVSGGDGEMYFTPAAVCNHITFAVAVEYAHYSADQLTKLLEAVPGTSLTLFSGYGSVGISPGHVKELLTTYGTTRLFLDLKLSKAWRTCGVGAKGGCCLQ